MLNRLVCPMFQGVFNFCNPGAISHNEILDLYKQYIDPTFEYTNFTVEEHDKILVAKRSNNTLVSATSPAKSSCGRLDKGDVFYGQSRSAGS